MCREFGHVNLMIQRVWKNKTAIIRALDQNASRIKRFSETERSDVNGALLKVI